MENFDLVAQLKLELIRGYEEYVGTVAGLTGASVTDAREAFHEAICQMLVGLRNRPPGNPIVAWRPYIIRAVTNKLIDARRRQYRARLHFVLFGQLEEDERKELMDKEAPGPSPDEEAQARDVADLLWSEVGKLSPRQKSVVTRWARGQTYREIGEALRIKPASAQKEWKRGIRNLRKRPAIRRLAA